MLCYKEGVDSKKGSPLAAAEFARHTENYKYRPEASVKELEHKSNKHSKTKKKRKLVVVDPLNAKQQVYIKRKKMEAKKQISSRKA